jgi:hypothetical protein
VALKRVDRSVSLQLREPISKNRLEDARTLALIPRLPYPGSAKDLRTRPHHAEEYKRLFNMFDTQYHISPENLRVVLYVADLIKQPIPFIRVPSVRDC